MQFRKALNALESSGQNIPFGLGEDSAANWPMRDRGHVGVCAPAGIAGRFEHAEKPGQTPGIRKLARDDAFRRVAVNWFRGLRSDGSVFGLPPGR